MKMQNLIIKLHNGDPLTEAEEILVLKHQLDLAEGLLKKLGKETYDLVRKPYSELTTKQVEGLYEHCEDVAEEADNYFYDKEELFESPAPSVNPLDPNNMMEAFDNMIANLHPTNPLTGNQYGK